MPGLDDYCIRDDSTECDCSRCTAAEDAFWYEQGEGVHFGYEGSFEPIDDDSEPPDHTDRPEPEDDLSW